MTGNLDPQLTSLLNLLRKESDTLRAGPVCNIPEVPSGDEESSAADAVINPTEYLDTVARIPGDGRAGLGVLGVSVQDDPEHPLLAFGVKSGDRVRGHGSTLAEPASNDAGALALKSASVETDRFIDGRASGTLWQHIVRQAGSIRATDSLTRNVASTKSRLQPRADDRSHARTHVSDLS